MKPLDLNKIRENLRRLEDTIIIYLFERSQYKLNQSIYVPGEIKIPEFDGSFLDFLFKGTEDLHAKAGRYAHPEEHPFYPNILQPVVARKLDDIGIEKKVNVNDKIKEIYLNSLLSICEEGDDNKYGSAAIIDINCMQAISKRVHIGEQVAEAKFQEDPEIYRILIDNKDIKSIEEKLRNKQVEKDNLERVKRKGERYGINPEFISKFYEEDIMPLTIEVEINYFLSR